MSVAGTVLSRSPRRTDPEPGVCDPPSSLREAALWSLGAGAAAGLAAYIRYGYWFGLGDHWVLMPKGISMADPAAYQNDWFTHHAPQPHWLFDLVTQLGQQVGLLSLVYFVYWLASLLAFGLAAHWLTRRFLPGTPSASLLVGPLLVAGPVAMLGSTTPLLAIALPNVLGGCLAFLVLAALLTGRLRSAAYLALVTCLVHVQQGVNLAPVLILAAVLAMSAPTRRRIGLVVCALGLVGGGALIASIREIESTSGDEWIEICRDVIPFHCDANAWSWPYLASGALVLALAASLAWTERASWRLVTPAVLLPTVGLAVGVLADLLDVPILGALAQRLNVYRLAAIVLPLAAFALVWMMGKARQRIPGSRSHPFPLALVILLWAGADNALLRSAAAAWAPILAVGLIIWIRPRLLDRSNLPRTYSRNLPPAALVVLFVTLVGAIQWGPLDGSFGYRREDPVIDASLELGAALPEEAILAAPPGLIMLRALTGRAVVADCKNVPYGGSAWHQYIERITALGGRDCEPESLAYRQLPPESIDALVERYGATHVLLQGDDPKIEYARTHWAAFWEASPADHPLLHRGWMVFALPERDA